MISVDRAERIKRNQSLKTVAIRTLDFLHISNAARTARIAVIRQMRRIRKSAQAHLLWRWRPLVPEESFTVCCRNAIQLLRQSAGGGELGCYLEFGVSRGTSLACMYHALQDNGLSNVRLIGFDSFRGLPPEAEREGWSPGAFWSARPATERYLYQNGVDMSRVTLVEGWFKDTLTQTTAERLAIRQASLIMIDCDIYSASRDALWFCEPFIRDRAVLFFDDWGRPGEKRRRGQEDVFAEFLAAFPTLRAVPLPAYTPNARVFLIRRAA